jgi:hypothetical protein
MKPQGIAKMTHVCLENLDVAIVEGYTFLSIGDILCNNEHSPTIFSSSLLSPFLSSGMFISNWSHWEERVQTLLPIAVIVL